MVVGCGAPSTTGIRLRPGSGCTSENDSASTAAVDSTSMPAAASSVGTRSTWEVGDVTTPAVGGPLADAGDDEGHPSGLVVEVEPLLVQAAVRAEQVTVIGGAHQNGVDPSRPR